LKFGYLENRLDLPIFVIAGYFFFEVAAKVSQLFHHYQDLVLFQSFVAHWECVNKLLDPILLTSAINLGIQVLRGELSNYFSLKPVIRKLFEIGLVNLNEQRCSFLAVDAIDLVS